MLWIGQAKSYNAASTDSLTCKGYRGIASDGQYLYYAPFYDGSAYHGRVLRQKIFAIFTDAGTWEAYDAGATDSLTCKGYSDVIFDGQFIYFVPYNAGGAQGVVLRYDTTKPFKSASSWDSYDAGATDSLTCKGFLSAAFDGSQFIYFIPYNNGAYNGIVLRYDITKPFKSASSWDAYNCGSLATGFWGGVIEGNFLYMSPYTNGSSHGKIIRYDLSKPFKSAGSWQSYDVTAINSDLKGFAKPCTDGHFIYFPNQTGNTILRFDTTKPFSAAASYSYFNVTSLSLMDEGHSACCIQGNYVVFSPNGADYLVYDTTKPFSAAASWAFKVCLASGMNTYGFRGCYGDPNYIYFAPYQASETGYHGTVGRIRVDPCPSQGLPTPGSTENLSSYMAFQQEFVTRLTSSATASPDDASCFASCLKDYELDFFNGFEIRFGLRLISVNDVGSMPDPETSRLFAFSLSRVYSDAAYEDVGSNDVSVAIIISWDEDGNVTGRKIHLIKGLDAARSAGYSISAGTTYYCKVVRTAGSATITCYIYSDSSYSTLVSTQSLASFSTTGKWRFIYALRGMYDPENLATATWRVESLKIVSY